MNRKIISYNVNGIRSAFSKGFGDWVLNEQPDILHVQETKAEQQQVDIAQLEALGYKAFWHSAQKKGYSGVASFTRIEPDSVQYGIGIDSFDAEGRFLRLDFGDITFINSYFPSGTTGDERQTVKEAYLEAVLAYLVNLKKQRNKIIISGDFNICHKPIDINHPKRHEGMSGFLPNERQWMDRLETSGFVDSFRKFNTEADQYSWWSYRAGSRGKNLGWRIDYHWVSADIAPQLRNAGIAQSIVHSDHCPVWIELDF